MQYEVEQKFPSADLAAIRGKLLGLGASFQPSLNQADSYFAHPARDYSQTDEALRLRQIGDENLITYKGPKLDTQSKTRREIELPLAPGGPAFDRFAELLVCLGFRRVFTVCKQREPGLLAWEGQLVHLALDQVRGLGQFVELEIAADDSTLEQAKAAVMSLATNLGLGPSERKSYLELSLSESS
jgi:adenylate cyclase class 2